MSSDSKMMNPYDLPEELATRPMSSPNLRTDSAEDIVLALAASDPLAFVALGVQPGAGALGAVVRQERFPINLECVLCHGEIPHGHAGSCPWWRAECYRKAKGL